jgi:hypothetical protein
MKCKCPYDHCDHNLTYLVRPMVNDTVPHVPCQSEGKWRVTRRDSGDDAVLLFCEECYREHRGVMVDRVSDVEPQPFGPERAQELWDARGLQWSMNLTPGEDAYVRQVWDNMKSGSSTWMDAFFRIMNANTACKVGGEVL